MTSDDLLHKPYTTITNTKTTYVIFLTVDYTVKDGLQSIHAASVSTRAVKVSNYSLTQLQVVKRQLVQEIPSQDNCTCFT